MPLYENERARQMRENAEFLASLCIGKPVLAKAVAPKKRVTKPRDADEHTPTRGFNMCKRSKPISYRENDYYADTAYSYRRKKTKKGSGVIRLRRADSGRCITGNRVYGSKLG
ncbi:hypothetical protein IW140_001754 [Coemansia sp. RSA 1813]|nr:hypothetical protein EV178_002967 [Coemansia sp. RSA 1646]KAJ1769200.1 hypothetical protein LPJ74_004261 [Coemansia sp. RSA 1843]KAJ2090874.1 hypothetical protein IW138_002277 [Coemansia sp. RSA 986]KAJ2213181.1 hypothetical protein EV179_004056 [Coemansia sp. RSA 487]KAJ2571299.1 hypothetical protein IW140_001754 [Coemansia sp. RSA 1813]